MTILNAIFRHPVKAVGGESLPSATLAAGETLPGDRRFAVLHDHSRLEADREGWARCTTFLRGAAIPSLMAVTSRGAPGGAITFQHPDLAPLSVDLDTAEGEAAFLAWMDPLVPAGAPRPAALHRADRGITDSRDKGMVTVMSDASLAALGAAMGLAMDRGRFRGNLWIGGLPAWREMALAGARLSIGGAVLALHGPVERCSATLANPATGRRDADVLRGLEKATGAIDFGMKATVLEAGQIRAGDAVEIL
ncbi:MOSC domain-containing protein [Rhodovulum sp. DZ06]|uniref:MOSC domain-containing protein n=1 Tax=Rhodovulum sp. DZ06 TaxID=3425126 RepID=UPI003D34CF33